MMKKLKTRPRFPQKFHVTHNLLKRIYVLMTINEKQPPNLSIYQYVFEEVYKITALAVYFSNL